MKRSATKTLFGLSAVPLPAAPTSAPEANALCETRAHESVEVATDASSPPAKDTGASPATDASSSPAGENARSKVEGGPAESVAPQTDAVSLEEHVDTGGDASVPSAWQALRETGDLRDTSGWGGSGGEDADLTGMQIGSYRLLRPLGQGAAGTVYLGEHPVIGVQVAIKVLHEEFSESQDIVDRFIQEARAANAVDSPHIVRIHDFGKLPSGQAYAVMEFLQGQPLDVLLEGEGTLDASRAAGLMLQVAEAMEVAHSEGIIHRDLKPENLFVQQLEGRSEMIRILDFGIAKLMSAGGVRETARGAVIGTPLYCAPEQAAGRTVGPASDIYALGAVLYELLTGEPLFHGNVVEVLMKKSSGDAIGLGRLERIVPPPLLELVRRMLARDPAERPSSMAEVAAVLRALDGDGLAVQTMGLADSAGAWQRMCAGQDVDSAPSSRPRAGAAVSERGVTDEALVDEVSVATGSAAASPKPTTLEPMAVAGGSLEASQHSSVRGRAMIAASLSLLLLLAYGIWRASTSGGSAAQATAPRAESAAAIDIAKSAVAASDVSPAAPAEAASASSEHQVDAAPPTTASGAPAKTSAASTSSATRSAAPTRPSRVAPAEPARLKRRSRVERPKKAASGGATPKKKAAPKPAQPDRLVDPFL